MKLKAKKIIKTLFILLFIVIMFVVSFFTSYTLSNNKIETKKVKEDTISINKKENKFKKIEGITNILLLGTDERSSNVTTRTDTMIILTIDTINNKIKLTSLFRDALVNIPGHNKSKLNHAYAYGGVDLLEKTIEENYNLSIDKYALVNFNDFVKIIDVLGGVDVEIKKSELKDFNKHLKDIPNNSEEIKSPGLKTLTGAQALSYTRIRYNSGGEQGRTERQRKVISSMAEKMKHVSVFKYPSILNTIIKYIDTNLNFKDILDILYTANKIDFNTIETLCIPFEELSICGKYKDYGWVFRTDLDLTAKLLNDYIFKDIPVNLNNISKNNLTIIE
ncbi:MULTISPECIES: LCP family protein [unclassified Clostridioides]|nr:LCP family protein [Clostridioides sp. ES-S-0145-01]MCC0682254.1 LCP family protein [Clostridioides sp. ES-S-0005-03]MCC0705517.1 LCP family protein [Clostridioides sp. ES-S-0190-01]UDN63921.1 LCP family protein [Clostridioides sp. ES-W-0016-02]